MAAGYVYILINPAFRGLLKIGKTTRTAEERAVEISNGTGVPAKFLVAYDDWVQDCAAAERLVHTRLAKYRYGRDREFFRLKLKEALPVVMEVVTEVNATFTEEAIDEVDEANPHLVEEELVEDVVDEPGADLAERVAAALASNELTPALPVLIVPKKGWFREKLFRERHVTVTDKYLKINSTIYEHEVIESVQVLIGEQRRRFGRTPIKLHVLYLKIRGRHIDVLANPMNESLVMNVFKALTTTNESGTGDFLAETR